MYYIYNYLILIKIFTLKSLKRFKKDKKGKKGKEEITLCFFKSFNCILFIGYFVK